MKPSSKIEYKGGVYSYRELSKVCGINHRTLYLRIKKLGWTVEEAVEKPVMSNSMAGKLGGPYKGRKREYRGQQLTLREIAALTGRPYERVRQRLGRGWTLEEAAEKPFYGQREKNTYVHKSKD